MTHKRNELLRLAQLQTRVSRDKAENLARTREMMEQLRGEDVDLVCLGEMFACPYETTAFPLYAEPEGGDTWQTLRDLAREHRVFLSAGSVPEIDEAGHIYNTAYVFDPEGRQIAKHRKMHLFDVDIRGGQRFKESETLSPGREATVFDTPFGPMGLCICFDFRFPALARQMVDRGARLILVPAAFNMTTGPAHWALLFRARAVDNQCYTIGTSVARDPAASYVAWGHSIVADPFGRIISEMNEREGIRLTQLRLPLVEEIRQQLPLL